MRCLWIMFVTAVCFLFLLKLKWPKNKNKNRIQKFKNVGKIRKKEDKYAHEKLIWQNNRDTSIKLRITELKISLRSAIFFKF